MPFKATDPTFSLPKRCRDCSAIKEISEFPLTGRNRAYRGSYCRPCLAKKIREKRARNPVEHRQRYRDYQLKSMYGIPAGGYERMLDLQGGVCAICRKRERWKGKSLCVDHDHKTGAVRGLLCNSCNTGLANFCENTESLLNAAAYLRASRSVSNVHV